MARKTPKKKVKKTVETLKHEDATRKNIPTAEFQSVMRKDEQSPVRVAYERRNRDLDPHTGLARQGRAGLVGLGDARASPIHPGEGPRKGLDR